MRKLWLLLTFLLAQASYADTCPDLSQFSHDPVAPEGWTIMKPHMSDADATFESAMYQLSGMFTNKVFCNYTNGSGYPLILMSNNTYTDPNPEDDPNSVWQYQSSPYAIRKCTESRVVCAFRPKPNSATMRSFKQ